MRKRALVTALLASLTFAPAAHAGSCQGTVAGLSSTYNLAKGSGFLALRARPTAKSRMKGQLFNGNIVEVDRRRGNWLYVYTDNDQGWVFARYVRRGCDGI
ncbi:MAG: SH3 domain-containing protein [Pseudomonadota bacterium]